MSMVTVTLTDRFGFGPILPVKVSVTIDTMVKFDDDFDGDGDDTCKQTLSVMSTYCDGPRVRSSGAVSVVFSCIERRHICTLVSTSFQTKIKELHKIIEENK